MRTVLASFLFVDVVGFSKVSATEQHAFKAALIPVLQRGLAIFSPQQYRLRDTGDGALVTFLDNPEHALYLALSIAQDCGQPAPGQVLSLKNLRTGINLGTVRESLDVESRPNYVGDGINAAQRVMDFAQPGQITASRSYMESVGPLDAAYAPLFVHLGPRADKHGRQHELFAIAPDDQVLQHMRSHLAGPRDAERRAETAPPAAAAQPTPPPTPAAPTASASPAAASTAPARRYLVGALTLTAVAALAGVAATRWLGSRPASPAPPVAETAAPAATPPAAPAELPIQPAPQPPASNAPAAASEPASAATAPPGPATTAASAARPATPKPPPQPPRKVAPPPPAIAAPPPPAAAAPSTPTARCSRLTEKAGLGEPLSPEEKKELTRSC